MPKFQSFDVLYLQCATSVCDKRRDPKPDCDRSCVNRTRTSRHVTGDLLAASKGRRSADQKQIFKQSRDEMDVGPFFVWGVGQDYIISEDGDVVVFQRLATGVNRISISYDVVTVILDVHCVVLISRLSKVSHLLQRCFLFGN